MMNNETKYTPQRLAIEQFCSQPWTVRIAQCRPFIPAAKQIASALGPLEQAGDHCPAGLACAQVNAELLLDGWCTCQEHSSANDCYFAYYTGSHGWMCQSCRRMTQSG